MASYLLLFRQSSLQIQIIITRDWGERAQIQVNTYIHTYVCVHLYIKLLPVKAGGKLLNKVMENVKQCEAT